MIRSIRLAPVVAAALIAVVRYATAPAAIPPKPAFTPPERVLFDEIWKSDAFWTRDFAVPGVDGPVTVIESQGGDLYVGGLFTQIDGVEVVGLARSDGLTWQASPLLAAPAPSAMLADGPSMVIAGDFIDRPQGTRYSVVRWSRNEMVPLGGSGMRGRIVRLFRFGGELVAAGYLAFEDLQSQRFLLARLEGERWAPLGPDVGSATYQDVYDAIVFQGRIVIGGRFQFAGLDGPAGLVTLRADESAYEVVLGSSPPSGTLASQINKLELHQGRLVAAGSLVFPNHAGGNAYRVLAAWDGVTWTPLDDTFGGSITALRSTSEGLVIGGQLSPPNPTWPYDAITVGRLDASGLHALPGIEGTHVLALAPWKGRLVAGGRSMIWPGDDHNRALLLAVRDGEAWRLVGDQGGKVTGLSTAAGYLFSGDVQSFLAVNEEWFAAGRFDVAWRQDGWYRAGPVARWEPSGWVGYGIGDVQGSAHALAWYDGHLYAAGSFTLMTAAGYVQSQLIRSEGGEWTPVDGAPASSPILALAVFDHHLIVGGPFVEAGGGLPVAGIAAFDGQAWSAVGGAVPDGQPFVAVSALLVHQGALYAGGRFQRVGGVEASSIARWDGRRWSRLGDGSHEVVEALATHQNDIAVAGSCSSGPDCGPVMTWDGRNWHPVPNAPYNVRTMASHRGILFVAGHFPGTQDHFSADAWLRAWDGHEWHALGSGFQREQGTYRSVPDIQALAFRNDVLWVGGAFTRAGGHTAISVATWTGLSGNSRVRTWFVPAIEAWPNPSRPGAPIELSIAGGGAAEIVIHDLAGRRLHSLRVEPGADRGSAVWDGRDADGQPVPAGIYFARATREGRVIATRRLIRLP